MFSIVYLFSSNFFSDFFKYIRTGNNSIFGSILGGNFQEFTEGYPRAIYGEISATIPGNICWEVFKQISKKSIGGIFGTIFWENSLPNYYRKPRYFKFNKSFSTTTFLKMSSLEFHLESIIFGRGSWRNFWNNHHEIFYRSPRRSYRRHLGYTFLENSKKHFWENSSEKILGELSNKLLKEQNFENIL